MCKVFWFFHVPDFLKSGSFVAANLQINLDMVLYASLLVMVLVGFFMQIPLLCTAVIFFNSHILCGILVLYFCEHVNYFSPLQRQKLLYNNVPERTWWKSETELKQLEDLNKISCDWNNNGLCTYVIYLFLSSLQGTMMVGACCWIKLSPSVDILKYFSFLNYWSGHDLVNLS